MNAFQACEARINQLREDNLKLQSLILAMADKLEICSRLLGKCAERKPCKRCERERREG